ncbi:MAG: hypothetical protein ACKPJJ_32240, partial [Planctomycetaceae bacterium]
REGRDRLENPRCNSEQAIDPTAPKCLIQSERHFDRLMASASLSSAAELLLRKMIRRKVCFFYFRSQGSEVSRRGFRRQVWPDETVLILGDSSGIEIPNLFCSIEQIPGKHTRSEGSWHVEQCSVAFRCSSPATEFWPFS